jgi:AbrB family looped-hinge helix DNA binding protein
MRSTITRRGQTIIPAEIRNRLHLTASDRLEWIVEGTTLRVIPVKQDPVAGFRGQGKGGTTARLIEDREADRDTE